MIGWLRASLALVVCSLVALGQAIVPSAIAARVRVEEPAPVLRATMPLAPGTAFDWRACPFEVVAPSGERCATQWEQVASWPDGTARVVELLALVPQAQAASTYSVEVARAPQRRAQLGQWARAWIDAAPRIELDGHDLPTTFAAAWTRVGPVALTRRFHAPNAFGWVTAFEGLDVVQLDLVFHNAHPRSPDLFFDALRVIAPGGALHAELAWPDPGVRTLDDGRLELVGPRADGYAHALVQRGAHWWSLLLHDGSQTSRARALARGAGFGVSDAWTTTDAYGIAALRLPDLSYRAAALRADLKTQWAAFSAALATGAPVGLFSGGSGRIDWQHAFNPTDGGSTGGGLRDQWHGVELAATAEPAGVLLMQARLATIMDRHAVSILRSDGTPAPLEDFCDKSGAPLGGWSVSAADARFDGKSDGAFGFAALQLVDAGARTPPWLLTFKQPISGGGRSGSFEPMDFQHLDRAIEDAEALAFWTGSPVAQWWLAVNAETWRAAQFSKGRLAGAHASALASPGHGTSFGREDAHGWRAGALSFAFGAPPWRARWRPYLERFAEALVAGQMPTGLYYRSSTRKQVKDYFGGAWACSKGTEEALVAVTGLGMARSVGVSNAWEVIESVDAWTVRGLWLFLWNSGATGGAPTDYIGVARLTNGTIGPIELDPAVVPRHGFDASEVASPLGCAMLLRALAGQSYAPEQLAAARALCGKAADPLVWMRKASAYTLQINDRAPLHAAFEVQP